MSMNGLLLLFLFLYFCLSVSFVVRWCLIILCLVVLIHHKKWFLMLIMVLMCVRYHLPQPTVSFPVTGYVTKIYDASFQIMTRYGTVQCISDQHIDLDSIVQIKGKLLNQNESSYFAPVTSVSDFTVAADDVTRIYQVPGIRYLIYRKIQTMNDPLKQSFLKKTILRLSTSNESFESLESVQLVLFLRFVKGILRKFLSQKQVELIENILMVFFCVLWSLPFVCFRCFYFRFMKRSKISSYDQLGGFGVLIYLFSQRLASSSSFWFIFMLRLAGSSGLSKTGMLTLIGLLQLCFMHTVNLIELLLFRFHQMNAILSFGLGLCLLCFDIDILPWINYISCCSKWIPSFELRGSISLFMILFFVFLYSKINLTSQTLTGLMMVLLFGLLGTNPFSRVLFLNVGQGDAILIQSPLSFTTILIDTGPPSSYWQLRNSLYAQSVYEIDLLIVTHDDSDHSGNKEALMQDFHVKRIWDNTMNDVVDKVYPIVQINELSNHQTDNDNSLVLITRINGLDFLFCGDASKKQEIIFSERVDEQMEICKIGHHGSDTSTSWQMLDQLGCKIAIVSASKDNRYGHPHQAVLERLRQNDSVLFNTAVDGDIQIVMTRFFNLITTSFYESVIIIRE